MKSFTIIGTEISDNTENNEDGSEVSVGVCIEIERKKYCLEFQTTTTSDYGAYSATLESYPGNADHDALAEIYDDDFELFLNAVKEQAKPEERWECYMNTNYTRSEDHFGGMD